MTLFRDTYGVDLITFPKTDTAIRVVMIAGDPWFVAADVCRVVGLKNPTTAIRVLSGDERAKSDLGPTAPSTNLVSESGLYKLVMRSDKPEARAFQDWVTRDVLPAIHRDSPHLPARTECM